jgi:CheY-like chemotaxis protein
MKRILIADASKASLVMTSEVFKDHFPGVQVVVARTSADAIEAAKSAGELDAFIIDYDLPDRDGAYTAARLKKQFAQPVLITAFDRLDVQENIDRELSAFDDCLSWIKKPVKPEMVVSLAQRFIEGKHRCQRRVDCSLPAFIEVELTQSMPMSPVAVDSVAATSMVVARAKVVSKKAATGKATTGKAATGKAATGKAAAGKAATGKAAACKAATGKAAAGKAATGKAAVAKVAAGKAATGKAAVAKVAAGKVATGKAIVGVSQKAPETKKIAKKSVNEVVLKPIRKIIPVLIDDVSLGGLKVRISNADLTVLVPAKGKSVPMSCSFSEGQVLRLFVPPAQIIASGADALDKWKKSQGKRLNSEDFSTAKSSMPASPQLGVKSSTLSPGAQLARNTLSKQPTEAPLNQGYPLHADVRWTASSESFTFCGLKSESVNTSKKLFEAMIEIELRMRSQLSPTVSPNSARLSKLNA